MVTQDGHLFHESVRSNLLFAAPDATEADLWEVLSRARLDTLVRVAAGRVGHDRGGAGVPAVGRASGSG